MPDGTAIVPADPSAQQAAFLRKFEEGAVAEQEGRVGVGVPSYVSFVWAKTSNDALKAEIVAAGGTIPTFVLSRAGFRTPLRTLRYHLFDLQVIATLNDDTGKLVDAEPEMPTGLSKAEYKRWARHAYAVVGVLADGIIVPASVNFRAGARHAIVNAGVALRDANNPDLWAKRGARYAATVEGTQYPAGRFVATSSIRPEKSETSGHIMLSGSVTLQPSTTEELSAFNDALSDRQFFRDLESTFSVHQAKLKTLLSKRMMDAEDE